MWNGNIGHEVWKWSNNRHAWRNWRTPNWNDVKKALSTQLRLAPCWNFSSVRLQLYVVWFGVNALATSNHHWNMFGFGCLRWGISFFRASFFFCFLVLRIYVLLQWYTDMDKNTQAMQIALGIFHVDLFYYLSAHNNILLRFIKKQWEYWISFTNMNSEQVLRCPLKTNVIFALFCFQLCGFMALSMCDFHLVTLALYICSANVILVGWLVLHSMTIQIEIEKSMNSHRALKFHK